MIPYLQVENLTKSFGDLLLFHEISFGLAQGQRVGLIAKNGSGKTTLLNILAGKEGYDEGTITFRRDLRVGYLEQSFLSGRADGARGLFPSRKQYRRADKGIREMHGNSRESGTGGLVGKHGTRKGVGL